jgi:drug/metabolite transporter (DMT)-like permease
VVSAPTVDAGRIVRRTPSALLALIGVTAVWGSTFPLSKDLLTRVAVTDYLALRFLVAAAVIGLSRPGTLRRIDGRVLLVGAGLGLCYSAGQALQFFGLRHTAATVSAFVVSMYVVFTPLLAALLVRARPRGSALLATALASAGVATMSLRGWTLGFGEALTLGAAALYALHILGLSRWSTGRTAYPLTFVQLLTMGLCFLAWAAHDGVHAPGRDDILGFLYLSVVAGAGAMLVQTWAQSHIPPAAAAVVMVLEPVWAAFFGLVVWHEPLDGRTAVGGALVVCATLLVLVMSRRARAAASGAADAAGVGAVPPTPAPPSATSCG